MISRELTRKVMADASNVSIACNITYLKTAVQFSKGKPNREIRYFIPNISYNLKECLKCSLLDQQCQPCTSWSVRRGAHSDVDYLIFSVSSPALRQAR